MEKEGVGGNILCFGAIRCTKRDSIDTCGLSGIVVTAPLRKVSVCESKPSNRAILPQCRK